ncbi:MAG: FHA domain-containing protein [Chloroflexi bacterium]|nr:FHA domain-containing protein [Chloroflexota bacterium]
MATKAAGQRTTACDRQRGRNAGRGRPLSTAPLTSIGRAPSSTIVLDYTFISQEHALLMERGGQWWLEDLGSRNGTLLNGAPLTETAVVSSGDIITIGEVQLKLEL